METNQEISTREIALKEDTDVVSDVVSVQLDLDSDINQRLETLVRGISSCVPYVGGAISGVIGFFWPSPDADPYAVWNEVKQYVMNLVVELINQERLKDLENKLEGIRKNLFDYRDTSLGVPAKGQWFTSVLSSLDNAEPSFFDKRAPETTLPYFVSLGTIKLSVLREQYLFYKEIYMCDDPDKNAHLKLLRDKIKEYSDGSLAAKAAIIKWRLDLITKTHTTTQSFGILGPSTNHIWTVKDEHVTDKMNPKPDLEVSWQYNTLTGGNLDAEDKANYAYTNRVAEIRALYEANLDKILSPAYLWDYLDPTNPKTPQKKPVYAYSGPFAGRRGDSFNDNPNGQPITAIRVYAGSRVDGVEVFYGGVSGGLHGARGGTLHELRLVGDEAIVSAYGRAGDSMDALYFQTNKGNVVGGGGGGGAAWQAAPPADTNAILTQISGVQGSRSFEGIKLQWCYWRYE